MAFTATRHSDQTTLQQALAEVPIGTKDPSPAATHYERADRKLGFPLGSGDGRFSTLLTAGTHLLDCNTWQGAIPAVVWRAAKVEVNQ